MKATKVIVDKMKWGVFRHKDTGHFLTDYTGHRTLGYVMEPGVNYVVEDTLRIGNIERGQSAAGLRVKGDDQTYYMSVGNMAETLRAVADGRLILVGGGFRGLWTFTKQGNTISITPNPR